jgi:hypothetical protein
MSMLEDDSSRFSLLFSVLLHALLVAPVWGWLSSAQPAVADADAPPMRFTFVEARDAPEEPPDEPTALLSTRDQRAAQESAPSELPEGSAFQLGQTPLPVAPRVLGSVARAASTTAEPRSSNNRAPGAESVQRPAGEGPRTPSGDARLAVREKPIGLAAGRSSSSRSGARLPAPEVDQRLTRARAGSRFSLNTTAWEYGPYMARLKAQIEEHIFPPSAFYYGTAAWATRVRFRIAPDGRLMSVELLDHRGVPNLQYVATSSIEAAADYEPLPPGFPEPLLEVTGNFYFNVAPPGR